MSYLDKAAMRQWIRDIVLGIVCDGIFFVCKHSQFSYFALQVVAIKSQHLTAFFQLACHFWLYCLLKYINR